MQCRMLCITFLCVGFLFSSSICAADSFNEAGKKAEEIHEHASSDIIFTEAELKALYYQNIQIIELLKEIKELLRQNLTEINTVEQE